jgi:hypothetical protein
MRARCGIGRRGSGCAIARSSPLPVPAPAVLQFLVDHVERSPAGGSRADRSPDDPRRATPRGRHAARSVYGRRVA